MIRKVLRPLALSLGFVCVGLGIFGIFLPLLPATPFFLLAAWLFLKSSKAAHDWLHQQPGIGTALRDWESKGAIQKKTKVIAISMILASIAVMAIREMPPQPIVRAGVFSFLGLVSLFIVTRPGR